MEPSASLVTGAFPSGAARSVQEAASGQFLAAAGGWLAFRRGRFPRALAASAPAAVQSTEHRNFWETRFRLVCWV